jgi:hypothetical protein
VLFETQKKASQLCWKNVALRGGQKWEKFDRVRGMSIAPSTKPSAMADNFPLRRSATARIETPPQRAALI